MHFRVVLSHLLAAAALHAAPPVGLVLADSDGEIQRHNPETPLLTQEGVELLPGDVLHSGQTPLTFAYCPTKQIVTLASNQTVRIDGLRLPPSSITASVCELPDLTPLPNTPTTPRRAPRLTSQSTGRVAQLDHDIPRNPDTPALLIQTALAVRLEKAGYPEEALAQYDAIHRTFKKASWTEAVSASLAYQTDTPRGTIAANRTSSAPLKTYAVLIGISDYPAKTGMPSLNYAAADADLFAEYLESDRGGKLKLCKDDDTTACEMLLLKDSRATLARVGDAFKPGSFVSAHANPDNELVIFVAAHGLGPAAEDDWKSDAIVNSRGQPVAEPEPVIVTYDSDVGVLNTTALHMWQLRQDAVIAAQSYGRVLVFVDVCRAGYVNKVQESPEMHDATQKTFELNRRTGVFMASDRTNNAFEYKELGGGHGAFSYYAIAGMSRTPASGTLAVGDLALDIAQNVRTITGGKQFPTVDAPDQHLIVVDDLSRPAIALPKPDPISETSKPRGRGPMPAGPPKHPPESEPRDARDPLRAGRLRADEPDSAWAEWERLKQSGSAAADAYANRLRIALEDRGQQVILKYLRGDQEPMKEAEFSSGAMDFEAALQIVPSAPFNESRALFCRGRALIFHRDPQDFARAIDLLQQSIQLDGKRSYAYNALGIAYLEHAASDDRRLRLAEAALHDAIHYAPYWPYPWHNLALVASERGYYSAAIDHYRHAMKLAPQYPYLPYNLGLLYQRINRLKDAAAQYQKALDTAIQSGKDLLLYHSDGRKPEEAEALNALGTLMEKRSPEKAADYYKRSIAADRDVLSARHNLAALVVRTGLASFNPEALWKEALAIDPHHEPSLLGLARYLVAHGRLEEARAQYAVLVENPSAFGPAHREYGAVLASLNRPEDALKEFQLSQNVVASDATILEALGDTLQTNGHPDLARQAYQLAIQALGPRTSRKTKDRLTHLLTEPRL
jgi:tetratricopeptide (TPR) repeat protein